jgi:hypothetical protein
LAWLGPIAELLDELEVRWVLAGALAADRYRAEPRYTTDLDLLITWSDAIPGALESFDYDVRTMADPGSHPHLLMLRSSRERIDLIVAVVPYQELAIERGVAEHVLAIEDVVVHKLIAWRRKDRDDIRSILEAGHSLDEAYIAEWVGAWEVTDRWAEAQSWRA